jgi:hypothetical protein
MSSQSPNQVGRNRNKKKIGNASVVWSKLCAAPTVVAVDRIRIRTIATIATIAHANRPIQHRFVALVIGIDFKQLREIEFEPQRFLNSLSANSMK